MSIKSLVKRVLLPSGLRPCTIRGGALKGMRFILDLQNNSQNWRGLYEECLQGWLVRYMKPGDYCLDIGAADGYFSLLMAKLAAPDGRVFAFEPAGRFDLIRECFALNSKVPLAKLEEFKAYVGAASAPPDADGVPTVAIDQMIADGQIPRVDIVKIDVDGPEVLVMKGMMETLAKFRPHLFLEIHSRELLEQTKVLTNQLGYKMELEMPAKRECRPIEFNPFYFSVAAR